MGNELPLSSKFGANQKKINPVSHLWKQYLLTQSYDFQIHKIGKKRERRGSESPYVIIDILVVSAKVRIANPWLWIHRQDRSLRLEGPVNRSWYKSSQELLSLVHQIHPEAAGVLQVGPRFPWEVLVLVRMVVVLPVGRFRGQLWEARWGHRWQ